MNSALQMEVVTPASPLPHIVDAHIESPKGLTSAPRLVAHVLDVPVILHLEAWLAASFSGIAEQHILFLQRLSVKREHWPGRQTDHAQSQVNGGRVEFVVFQS